jgi:RimJ/RimL family protein N-acetyltransferase
MRGWLAPDPANLRLAVVKTDDGALLGRTALLQIAAASAELHLFLGDPHARGRGYGKAAVDALLIKAFEELDLETVRLEVLASNAPALALYRRCGADGASSRPPRHL